MPEPIKPDAPKEEKKVEGAQPAPADKKEEKKEQTVGEIIDGDGKKKESENQPETVPLAAHLELKKENKEMKQALKALEKRIDEGADAEDLSDDIESLADEYKLDRKFLGKLTKAIEKRAEARAGEVAEQKTQHITKEAEEKRIDKVFTKHFSEALADMPEFKDIADPDVIKTLSLDPKNANKTFRQLIENTYGKALGGKRTIEQTKPRGGKEPEEIDFDRAKKDSAYYKEIMADPATKKKYNEGLTDRLSKHL